MSVKKTLYYCNECLKSLSTKWHLKRHLETHEIQVRRHSCTQCSKQFSSKENVKRHFESVHTGVRPRHTCTECSKSFQWKCNLTEHVKSDHRGVAYSCTECSRQGRNSFRPTASDFCW
uniref:Krueppel-related zinc finger protein 1 n=1 Tax=Cacopsylla melanoneura TaxID=428564 RepID=A0A8D8WT15_9HEMI